jgi:hypothetical protein
MIKPSPKTKTTKPKTKTVFSGKTKPPEMGDPRE